jgi:hypothetical protein
MRPHDSIRLNDTLIASRAMIERCRALVERALAAQGEHAEPDLVKLQHDLADLTRPRN